MLARGSIPVVIALGLLGISTLAVAGEKPNPPGKLPTRERCERLVEQLVNPGKAPFRSDDVPRLPKGITTSDLYRSQAKIAEAYNDLSDNIEAALPVLMKHIDDNRFSYVFESGSGNYTKATVGDACNAIVWNHVEPYAPLVTVMDEARRQYPSFVEECGGLKLWWKGRSGRSLAELQVEGIEWALHRKRPDYFESEREWVEAKRKLEKMAREVRASNKSVHVDHHVQFFSK